MSDRKPGGVIDAEMVSAKIEVMPVYKSIHINVDQLAQRFGFTLPPTQARQLAADLIHFAEEVELAEAGCPHCYDLKVDPGQTRECIVCNSTHHGVDR